MRRLFIVAMVLIMVGTCGAEVIRPMLTKENKFPGANGMEVGLNLEYQEFIDNNETVLKNDKNAWWYTPYARYGVTEDFAVFAKVPYGTIKPDIGDDEEGIGDVSVGFELLAFEDIFDYPYIIPHIEYFFATGDEDKGFGEGDGHLAAGLTVGTTVEEFFILEGPVHFNADVRYELYGNRDNIFKGAVSVIWDISDQLSFLMEGMISDEERESGQTEHPARFQGGMCYYVTEQFEITLYGGGVKNSDQDVIAGMKAAYTF